MVLIFVSLDLTVITNRLKYLDFINHLSTYLTTFLAFGSLIQDEAQS